jgi:hypothetical protein
VQLKLIGSHKRLACTSRRGHFLRLQDQGLNISHHRALLNHIQLELRTMLRHRKNPKVRVQLSGFRSVFEPGFFYSGTAFISAPIPAPVSLPAKNSLVQI